MKRHRILPRIRPVRPTLFVIGLLSASWITCPLAAQSLVITPLDDASELVHHLLGPAYNNGIEVVPGSETLTGGPTQQGRFTTRSGCGLFDFSQGLVLSTGAAGALAGQNDTPGATRELGTAGDVCLDAVFGAAQTRDANVLRFQFTVDPDVTSFELRYVLASEEYTEYVGSQFNDVLGIFVDPEPLPGDCRNFAVVPESAEPVSIYTVNAERNPGFYVDNSCPAPPCPFPTEADGFTTGLSVDVLAAVRDVAVHEMVIAIADVADAKYDAWGLFTSRLKKNGRAVSDFIALPPPGTIDARQPHPLDSNARADLQGIGSPNSSGGGPEPITVTLGPDLTGYDDPTCWDLCETDPLKQNEVSSVTELEPGVYEILLDRPIVPGHWTTLIFRGDGSEFPYASLPADVNGDATAAGLDITALIDFLNGVAPLPHGLFSCDADHSTQCNGLDITRTIDLLNGANSFTPWNAVSLPFNHCDSCLSLCETTECLPEAPSVMIQSPIFDTAVHFGEHVVFAAEALDPQEGDLGDKLIWISDLAGIIGRGASFTIDTLPLGKHLITAMVTDGTGLTGFDLVEITVKTLPPEPCADCLDFSVLATTSYSNQDISGNVTVEEDGAAIRLIDNTWRRTVATWDITPNTVLEFEFSSSAQGEIHGIGFDEDDNLNNAPRLFQLYGSQNWTGSGRAGVFSYEPRDLVKIFRIPVGTFYTGSGMRLVLINDNDSGLGNESLFRNVRIFEEGPPSGSCAVEEDFEGGAAGWENDVNSSCTAGDWVVGNPTEVINGGVITQPSGSSSGFNSVFTATNSSAGVNDVDGGNCILSSPVWPVSEPSTLGVSYWHGQRDAGDDPNDFFRLEYSVDGRTWEVLAANGDSTSNAVWSLAQVLIEPQASVQLRVQCSDGAGPGDLIECGIDDVAICPAIP